MTTAVGDPANGQAASLVSSVKPLLDAISPATVVIRLGSEFRVLTAGLLALLQAENAVAYVLDAGSETDAALWGGSLGPRIVRQRSRGLRALRRIHNVELALLGANCESELLYQELKLLEWSSARTGAQLPPVLVCESPTDMRSGANGHALGGAPLCDDAFTIVSRFVEESSADLALARIDGWQGVVLISPKSALEEHGPLEAVAGLNAVEGVVTSEAREAKVQRELADERAVSERLRGAFTVRDRELKAALERAEEFERRLMEAEAQAQSAEIALRRRESELAALRTELEPLLEPGARLARALAVARRARHEGGSAGFGELSETEDVPEMNLLILARTIERARAAVLAGTEELRGLRVAAKQGEEELIRVTEAKEALESQLEALESQRELFETKRAEAEAATQRAVDELASRANELKAEQDRHHKLTAQIQAQEQELEAARGKCDRAAEQLSAAEQELAALQRRHAEELTRVESERQILAECAMRMAASRSWRYGHSLSRILRRMTLRPPVKSQSALDVMLSILAPDAARLGAGDGPQQPPLLSSPTDS